MHIIFPFGIIQCMDCEKLWIVQPFQKVKQVESEFLNQEILNLNITFLKQNEKNT